MQRDENKKLKDALRRLLATVNPGNADTHEEGCMCVIHEARAALGKPERTPMTGFTPGPWRWWTSNSWRRLRGITQKVLEPYVSGDGHPDCSVNEADMALIAAAPDLYEALRMILEENEPTVGIAAGRRALAKARGEA